MIELAFTTKIPLVVVRLLNKPIPCRGNAGMWRLPEDMKQRINLK